MKSKIDNLFEVIMDGDWVFNILFKPVIYGIISIIGFVCVFIWFLTFGEDIGISSVFLCIIHSLLIILIGIPIILAFLGMSFSYFVLMPLYGISRFILWFFCLVPYRVKYHLKKYHTMTDWKNNHPGLVYCRHCNGKGTILVKKLIREARVVEYTYFTGGCGCSCDGSGMGYIACSGECYPHPVESFKTEPAIYENVPESCKYCNGLGGIQTRHGNAKLLGAKATPIYPCPIQPNMLYSQHGT